MPIQMKNEKLHFYLLRLQNSSLPEIIYRVKQFFFLKKLKRLLLKKKPFAVPKIAHSNIEDLQLPSFHGQASKNLVQKILSGELFALNSDVNTIRKFEEDNHQFFFSDIKSDDRNPDIRAVWEPARLQHLIILLKYISQAKESSDVITFQRFAKDSVIEWIQLNHFLFGPHHISAMECGLRISVFFYCLKSVEVLDDNEFKLILDAIYRHAWLISKRLSLYSSLGNHTVCESVGLIFAGSIFRNTEKGREWLKTGTNLLKQELYHQILNDGGPAEQSLNYHRFVLDLYWLAVGFLEENKLHKCSEFKDHLIQAEYFLSAFEKDSGTLPSIGDSDDGHAIAPGLHPRRIIPNKKNERLQTFSSSGYTVINCKKVVLTFDHGSLGMPPFYNHGHADALSIILSVDGKEMLVDPGTFRYNGTPEWRRYFKGTRAHNTVTIDGLDQAVQETGFIWSRPYKAKLVKSVEKNCSLFLQANHDGYLRIKEPVRHLRSIVNFDKTNFFIKDTFFGKGVHTFELNYHVHPDSKITLEDNNWWKINNQGAEIFIRLLNGNSFNVIKGQKNPLFGWYSPSYGIKREGVVLSCTMRGTPKEVSFTTAICIYSSKEINTLT